MLYTWEQGPLEKAVIEQHLRNRQPLPKSIQNAPELMQGLELYYIAFLDLSTCRTSGFGEGVIPWLAIEKYAEVNGFSHEQTEDLHHHVRYLDRQYLEYQKAKLPRNKV